MPELYGITNCDSCRAARRWLSGRGLDTEFTDLRAHPPGLQTLSDWVERLGWETLLNRRSKTWRELPDAERQHPDARKAIELLHKHPLLIKRPVLLLNGEVHVGFDPGQYATIFETPEA